MGRIRSSSAAATAAVKAAAAAAVAAVTRANAGRGTDIVQEGSDQLVRMVPDVTYMHQARAVCGCWPLSRAPLTPSSNAQDSAIEGYLWKMTSGIRQWQRRWCALRPSLLKFQARSRVEGRWHAAVTDAARPPCRAVL